MKPATSSARNQFESSFTAFKWQSWLVAALGAALLNSGLFLFLPMFMDPEKDQIEIDKLVNSIQLIRLKKKETPPQKKKPKPPEPEKKKIQPKDKVKAPKPKTNAKLTLPFKLNTRLPSVSSDFQLQYADNIAFGAMFNGAVDVGQLDEPLTAVAKIPPVYPIRARRRGTEGWVRVAFEVDQQGFVDNLHVLDAKPPGLFERAVMQCVTKWRYNPGTVEGVPVRARMETTIRFELE